jgi:hypothetical protein
MDDRYKGGEVGLSGRGMILSSTLAFGHSI